MVSAIIPAFDEEETIAAVIEVALATPLIGEVIVVDDASRDRTAEVAARAGARVVSLGTNSGKAAAMEAGVRVSSGSTLLFLDADIVGLTPEMIASILAPVLEGRVILHVGIRDRSIFWLNRLLHVFPIIGGERALQRRLWDAVPSELRDGFKIETALNYHAKADPLGMSFEMLPGLRHGRTKEQKFGFRDGFRRRLRMIGEVVGVSTKLYVMRPTRRAVHRCQEILRGIAVGSGGDR